MYLRPTNVDVKLALMADTHKDTHLLNGPGTAPDTKDTLHIEEQRGAL